MLKIIMMVLTVLLLSGCATPTPYRPAINGTGYSERQIENNRFTVSFVGNNFNTRQQVDDYMLFRASEVTLNSGNDYFLVQHRDVERRTELYSHTNYHHSSFRSFYFLGHYPTSSVYQNENYAAFTNIMVFSGEKPGDNPNAYDAREVIKYLKPTIVFPVEDE